MTSPHLRGHAFTLIELLVVVAIIGILASILLPVLARARFTARQTACMNNMKQYGTALAMYMDDFGHTCMVGWKYGPGNYWMPINRDTMWDWSWNWDEVAEHYAGGKDSEIMWCPSQSREAFGNNTGYSLMFSVGTYNNRPQYPGPGWLVYNPSQTRYGKADNSGLNAIASKDTPDVQGAAVLVDTSHHPTDTRWYNLGRVSHTLDGMAAGQNALLWDGRVVWRSSVAGETYYASGELFPIVDQ